MDKAISDLLDYCTLNNRVCPKPMFWIQLWQLLIDRKKSDTEWQFSGPPIRAAWWNTADSKKQARFSDHINWACQYGLFEEVDQYIRSLPENQWHHLNE
jgi:hypothetical protein